MIKRNLPLILLFLAFVALLDIVYSIPRNVPNPTEKLSIAPEPEEDARSFTGRVVMPNIDDIYVLENSAGRDIVQLEKFLQGRAAGLHFLAEDYYKKSKRHDEDILVGLRLTLDSLGQFEVSEFLFSNTKDKIFKSRLVDHIKYYWRYPRGTAGKLEFWIPIRWLAKY